MPTVSFEVLALRDGGGWQLVEICATETAARTLAGQILKRRHCQAVRVVRDRQRADGDHSETIVWEQAGAPAAEADLSVSHVPDAAPCHTVSEVYGLPSRITIGRLLRKYLEHHVLTPTELLYSHRQLKRMGETGSLLMSAIDLAARVQAARGGVDSAARRDFLFQAWEKVCARAQTAARKRLAPLAGDSFAELVAGAARRSSQPNYAIQVLAARQLAYRRTWLDKLALLLDWLSQAEGRSRAWVSDGGIADLFLSKGFVEDLLGQQASLGAALATLLRLAEGRAEAPRGAPELFAALNRRLADGLLPETRDAIVSRVVRELAGAQPLDRHSPSGETGAFETLASLLVTPEGVYGGAATVEALTDRYCRILNTVRRHGGTRALHDIAARMPDGCRRLHYLLSAHALPGCAEAAELAIGDYLGDLPDAEPLFAPDLPMLGRLSAMTSLHRCIVESRLPIDLRAEFSRRLDRLQSELLARSGIIEQLDNPARPLSLRATDLVGLCRPGILIDGVSVRMARTRVVQELRQPNFDSRFIADAFDPAEARTRLSDFYRLLVQCGF